MNLVVPSNSISKDVSIKIIARQDKETEFSDNHLVSDTAYEFKAVDENGTETSVTFDDNNKAEIKIPYPDSNQDGIIDLEKLSLGNVKIIPEDLQICLLKDGVWTPEMVYTVNKNEGKIILPVSHLSIYALKVKNDEFNLTSVTSYPNPFTDNTQFIFELGKESDIKVEIYTVSGRNVRNIEKHYLKGVNQVLWDGKDDSGNEIANGTYLYKISVGSSQYSESGKIVKIK